jgi:protein tyrosine/serine phosphatase
MRAVTILVLIILTAGCQTPSQSGLHVSQLSNFGVVDDGKLYRGDAPHSIQDIQYLLNTRHVHTIIDLRDGTGGDGSPQQEKAWVDQVNARSTGEKINWVNLPCDAFDRQSVLRQFRKFRDSHDLQGPVFVHCQYGRDRTGLFVAAYQIEVMNYDPLIAANGMRDYGQNFLYVPGLYDFVRRMPGPTILARSSR